ncbi:MAG: hypothetical protein MRERC_1c177 [Mycoplasmataceae bacterium RC_NB112A]|nr:MAG: hypothetical protein MRERC_1c177 [Mycoplasmataceae bacterium RC_NB112A]
MLTENNWLELKRELKQKKKKWGHALRSQFLPS